MNTILTIALVCLCVPFSIVGENELANEYIEKYKDLAISEMQRTGIPASIKLAQALHESGMGRSTLAREANNHFGIKCGSSWDRKTYYIEDDDYRNGKKIKSCFRNYSNPHESFVAHSDFLSNSNRYSSLFLLHKGDYRSWATGLKKAGYATDPKYADKLIRVIEEYQLYQYDQYDEKIIAQTQNTSSPSNAESTKENESAIANAPKTESKQSRRTGKSDIRYNASTVNHTDVIVATGIESLRQIAKDFDLELKDIKEMNPAIEASSSQNLESGTVVYLENKKMNYKGSIKYHLVQPGETMELISNKYAIQLKALYLKNRMPKDAQPMPGEKVYLKGMIRLNNIPAFYRADDKYAMNDKSHF